MSKSYKKSFDDDEYDDISRPAPGGVTAGKIPLAINGGKTAIHEYMNIPTNQLVAFRNKQGRDFSRKNDELFQELVDSIRDGGIIDALTVRAIGPNQYEILAGETRWLAAQEAGLTTVPCHVMTDVDDTRARRIFTVTNLVRRTLLPSDRINGWWHYHQALKSEGRLKELKDGLTDPEIARISGGTKLRYRQIMYYVSMYTLIPEWLAKLDSDEINMRTGREIARLDEDKQRQLLPYKVSDSELALLIEVAEGKNDNLTWSESLLASILAPISPSVEASALEKASFDGEDTASDDEVKGPGTGHEFEFPAGGMETVGSNSSKGTEEGTELTGTVGESPETGDTPVVAAPLPQEAIEIAKKEMRFRKARPIIIKTVKSWLRPDDYEDAEAVIMQALKLYYEMLDKQAAQQH